MCTIGTFPLKLSFSLKSQPPLFFLLDKNDVHFVFIPTRLRCDVMNTCKAPIRPCRRSGAWTTKALGIEQVISVISTHRCIGSLALKFLLSFHSRKPRFFLQVHGGDSQSRVRQQVCVLLAPSHEPCWNRMEMGERFCR